VDAFEACFLHPAKFPPKATISPDWYCPPLKLPPLKLLKLSVK
jgi:hypothetical protein